MFLYSECCHMFTKGPCRLLVRHVVTVRQRSRTPTSLTWIPSTLMLFQRQRHKKSSLRDGSKRRSLVLLNFLDFRASKRFIISELRA